MVLYNTTFAIDPAIEQEFLEWLNQEFIDSAVADGQYFSAPELFKVGVTAGDGTVSYALHLRAPSTREIELWYEDHGSRLVDYLLKRWNGAAVCFSTTLHKQ